MALYQAFWGETLERDGIDNLLIARIRGPGRVEIGTFLVDAWCLGIKDAAFFDDATEEDLREQLERRQPEQAKPLDPAFAKKIIEGAAAYAERLGFAPARDFRKARRVLGGIDAAACSREFTFGCNGRPRYFAGPHDSPERIDRVLGILRARCGEDGFDFIAPDDEADDYDPLVELLEETAACLREELETAGPPAPSFRELCGVLGAIAAGLGGTAKSERLLETMIDAFVPHLRGEKRVEFSSALGMQLARTIDDFLVAGTAASESANPIQLVDVAAGDKADGVSFVVEWARGFLRAQELWPRQWNRLQARSELATHVALVCAWAHPELADNMRMVQQASAAGHSLPKAVLGIHRTMHGSCPATAAE